MSLARLTNSTLILFATSITEQLLKYVVKLQDAQQKRLQPVDRDFSWTLALCVPRHQTSVDLTLNVIGSSNRSMDTHHTS